MIVLVISLINFFTSSLFPSGNDVNTTNAQTVTSVASCDPGDIAIGGSSSVFGLLGSGNTLGNITEIFTGNTADTTSYFATINVVPNAQIGGDTFANCFDNPPAHIH